MHITHVKIRNWKNFLDTEFNLIPTVNYVIGANASGKSNLLDVFRFLYDVSKKGGGGLQAAANARGGISKFRCLHVRGKSDVEFDIHLEDGRGEDVTKWQYHLGFNIERSGSHRLLVTKELVKKNNELLLNRPDKEDRKDADLLTETHLEQIRANVKFRVLSEFFNNISYLHLVPQLLKYSDKIGGNLIENDPFGQGFMERIANASDKTRETRLKKMQAALSIAVPQFHELRFQRDEKGRPHLEALYAHHRPRAGWQREEQFSDGTLRLISIMWSLLDGNGFLLLEEPELCLNQAVVEQIPALIYKIQTTSRKTRQVFISTHSDALLSNMAIDPNGVINLETSDLGTKANHVTEDDKIALNAGFSVAQTILLKAIPKNINQLSLDV
ncbi:MAG: AAA family ATPase [Alphaproteobacteria bacterium]|nr:AAA family ATPase [Alphaproteobacteria bacterium]